MIFRNLDLTDAVIRQEIKKKLLLISNTNTNANSSSSTTTIIASSYPYKSAAAASAAASSLTLYNCNVLGGDNNDNNDDDDNNDADNCFDFLIGSHTTELIIERCQFDRTGCRALGKVLVSLHQNSSSSSSIKLRSLQLINVSFLLDDDDIADHRDDDYSDDDATHHGEDSDMDSDSCGCCCHCYAPILEGLQEVARQDNNGTLESLKLQRITIAEPPVAAATAPAIHHRSSQQQEKEKKYHHTFLHHLFRTLTYCTNLCSLTLADCNIGEDRAMHELAHTIRTLTTGTSISASASASRLTSLDLCRNHIDSTGIQTLLLQQQQQQQQVLSSSSSSTSSLKRLILSHNPIGDDGALHVANYASSSSLLSSLQSLQVLDCEIWSRGYASLATLITGGLFVADTTTKTMTKTTMTLQDLVVDSEMENHCDTIFEALRTGRNVTLQHLSIPGRKSMMMYNNNNNNDNNNDSDSNYDDHHDDHHHDHHQRRQQQQQQQWQDIDYYLQLNRGKLRRLSMEEQLPFTLWPYTMTTKTTTKTAATADIWFDALRRRPELMAMASSSTTTTNRMNEQ